MDHISVIKELKRLENTIRYLGKGSSYLMLEPLDLGLLAKLQNVEDALEPTDSAVSSAAKQIKTSLSSKTPSTSPAVETAIEVDVDLNDKRLENNIPAKPDLDPFDATNLDSLKLRLKDCQRCQLCQGRSNVVFGQGNHQSKIVFIGEGPGEEEDRTGLAFVGKAGKLLTQIIHSIGLNRESVYICNIVKCRPPGNRNPSIEETTACFPFLKMQLDFLKPKLIITLGNVATKALIPDALGIMKMRGRTIDYNGITLIPTFHPSYLLRNTSALADVWTDMRKIRQLLFQD